MLNALVNSGTLRGLGGETMIFRHDVLRDWAVANILHEDDAKILALPLGHTAPAALARGVELAARMAMEAGANSESWKTMLDRLSEPDVHGSWRRAVLVGLVRSELSAEALSKAKYLLLAESGRLLGELIRTLMALDVEPARRRLAERGMVVPEALNDVLALRLGQAGIDPRPDFDHSILIAAVLTIRDGDAFQREEHRQWANSLFEAAELLPALDQVYFVDKSLGAADLVRIRTAIARRLKETSSWRLFVYRPGYGISLHFGLALGAIFMTYYGFTVPLRCYITVLGIPRATPFIPLLSALAGEAPSLYVALITMSIVTVSPETPFLAFGVGAIAACMRAFPNDVQLWRDYGIGKQFCDWIESILPNVGVNLSKKENIRGQVDDILSNLIRLGVAEAAGLEATLLVRL